MAGRSAWAAGLALALAGASGCPPHNQREGMERQKESMAHRVDVLEYRIGNPHWEGGRTTLRLGRDGSATVINERAGQPERRFSGQVVGPAVEALIAQAERAGLWQVKQRQTAVPDEAKVTITLRDRGGTALREVVLWEGQFSDAEALKALKARLDGHVKEVSGGQVF
ncbi:MAG: hypothetical protein RMK29_22170 [Myxococcales bacterium]|nr:hypothetical protein [Myxococcota bacterium]MDW8284422.1 hypothetical protein [Myxococcales bacterium]